LEFLIFCSLFGWKILICSFFWRHETCPEDKKSWNNHVRTIFSERKLTLHLFLIVSIVDELSIMRTWMMNQPEVELKSDFERKSLDGLNWEIFQNEKQPSLKRKNGRRNCCYSDLCFHKETIKKFDRIYWIIDVMFSDFYRNFDYSSLSIILHKVFLSEFDIHNLTVILRSVCFFLNCVFRISYLFALKTSLPRNQNWYIQKNESLSQKNSFWLQYQENWRGG
jgi:hypothetical protein